VSVLNFKFYDRSLHSKIKTITVERHLSGVGQREETIDIIVLLHPLNNERDVQEADLFNDNIVDVDRGSV